MRESHLIGITGHVQGLVLEGNREKCPQCGEFAELPDGTFDVVGDTIHVLSASKLRQERLLRLQAILDSAQAGSITDDEAEQAVAEEAPEFEPLLTKLRPKMGRAFLTLLTAAVTILTTQALAERRDRSPTTIRCSARSSRRPPGPGRDRRRGTGTARPLPPAARA